MITEQTYYRWQREYGGLEVDQAKRLKARSSLGGALVDMLADCAFFICEGVLILSPLLCATDPSGSVERNPISGFVSQLLLSRSSSWVSFAPLRIGLCEASPTG